MRLACLGLIGILALAGLVGCVYTNTTVKLPSVAVGVGTPARAHQVVLIGPFVDARKERGRCGMKKNGYNGDTADILCAEPPAAWMARRLANDLRAAGVVVYDAPHAGELRIEGTLLELYSEPVPHSFTVEQETDINVRLQVTWPDGTVAAREFYVKGVESSTTPTNDIIQDSVDEATTTVSSRLALAVLMLLDRQTAYHEAAR